MACSQFKTGIFQLNGPWGRAVILPLRFLDEIMSFSDDQVSFNEFIALVSLPMFLRFWHWSKGYIKVVAEEIYRDRWNGYGFADFCLGKKKKKF